MCRYHLDFFTDYSTVVLFYYVQISLWKSIQKESYKLAKLVANGKAISQTGSLYARIKINFNVFNNDNFVNGT